MIDLPAITAAARGFSKSRWEYREDIPGRGYGAIVTDAGGDEGDVFVIDDTLDQHVGEPLALMLNAVAPLVEEVERLRSHVAALRALAVEARDEINGGGCYCGDCDIGTRGGWIDIRLDEVDALAGKEQP